MYDEGTCRLMHMYWEPVSSVNLTYPLKREGAQEVLLYLEGWGAQSFEPVNFPFYRPPPLPRN